MCPDSFITLKDVVYLVGGLVLGLIVGIGIYWWPLGQFTNEWKALWNLARHRYVRGTNVTIKSGTDLVRVGVATYPHVLTENRTMAVWHDEGVDWFHTANGWKRLRVLQVFDPSEQGAPPVYRVCHLDLVG